MNQQSFTTSIMVQEAPEKVYEAINHPQSWWSDTITGNPGKLHEEWRYNFGDHHITRLKTVELMPGKRVAWLVLENHFKNARDPTEWVGDTIIFDISKQDGKTKIVFTQEGLVPSDDCYKNCEWAWKGFVEKSLASLITTGEGQLNWYV